MITRQHGNNIFVFWVSSENISEHRLSKMQTIIFHRYYYDIDSIPSPVK